jgi:hypothetical protein
MYVTQDTGKQLTVVNPAVALRVALQGISGIVLFLVRHKHETQRAATTLLYGYPLSPAFVSLSHLRFISVYPVFPVLSRSSLNSPFLAQLRAITCLYALCSSTFSHLLFKFPSVCRRLMGSIGLLHGLTYGTCRIRYGNDLLPFLTKITNDVISNSMPTEDDTAKLRNVQLPYDVIIIIIIIIHCP